MILGWQKGKMTSLMKNLTQYSMALLTINQQPTQPKAFQYRIQSLLQVILLKKLLTTVIKIIFFLRYCRKMFVFNRKINRKSRLTTKLKIFGMQNFQITFRAS